MASCAGLETHATAGLETGGTWFVRRRSDSKRSCAGLETLQMHIPGRCMRSIMEGKCSGASFLWFLASL